ncbi:extracellular solute-binding protein [Paenibacillus whitsoniae]|uniref:Extracellular solute-binding protein n=1 Tax=Paenibacillus whitsoniae TaxID=2496558 RepID=A0A430JIB4_9BACL|nr:extracellular solute-binding protein [Paenibacillus whitsoniae]RTE10742.1 extracellular solute-binding protein [Paenibacillus whitsoniae]
MKKAGLVALHIALAITVLAGCTNKSGTESTTPGSSGKPQSSPGSTAEASKPVEKNTFTALLETNASWPYNKDWPFWKYLEEKTGATWNVQLPSGNLQDTTTLNVASGSLPDLTFGYTPIANTYGIQGVFANILDYTDIMPNFKKWMEKYPTYVKASLASDGKMYVFPNEGYGKANGMSWLYRQDIFQKNNLKTPATYDEFYQVLKQLKQTYPDSTPFVFRNGLNILSNMAPAFDTNGGFYLDKKTNKAQFGPIEPNYKKMVEYLHKFYAEGLIPADFLTVDTKRWQDMISTNKSFVTNDYIVRIDFFNTPMRKENPDSTLAFMPPAAGFAGAKPLLLNTQAVDGGLMVSAKSKKIKEIMKMMDFFYSEDGKTMASWGKEGETFTVENGKKKFKPGLFANATELANKYGLTTLGTYTWFDFDAYKSIISPSLQSAYDEADKYMDVYSPLPKNTQAELDTLSITGKAVNDAFQENISKFIVGQRSLAEWDQYVEELKKLGLQKTLDVYQAAFDRAEKAK